MLNVMIIFPRILKFITGCVFILLLSSCAPSSTDGVNSNELNLPTDTALTLYCATEGLNTDDCILFDPYNPYATTAVNDVTKWDLHAATPSAKARFYLWATALARNPSGENQYFTAQALHELYTINSDILIKDQAILAYRSVLDNFFGSVTYIAAIWVGPDVYYAELLADKVGATMYNPTPLGLGLLYTNNTLVLDAFSGWGYVYNITTGTMAVVQ